MTKHLERRGTPVAVELRASADGGRTIGGYAAKFMRMSQDLGGFVEQIDPRFFNKSAGDGWPGVMARYNHDDLLGTTAAESLRLSLDDTGLVYDVDLLDDAVSDRVHRLVARGDVSQSSFAFYTYEDDWEVRGSVMVRTLLSGKLVDVAPVDSPAYLDTSTGLRSLAELRGLDLDEVQRLARDGELTRLLKEAPKVIDLGTRSDDEKGQENSTPSGLVQVLLRDLELKKEN